MLTTMATTMMMRSPPRRFMIAHSHRVGTVDGVHHPKYSSFLVPSTTNVVPVTGHAIDVAQQSLVSPTTPRFNHSSSKYTSSSWSYAPAALATSYGVPMQHHSWNQFDTKRYYSSTPPRTNYNDYNNNDNTGGPNSPPGEYYLGRFTVDLTELVQKKSPNSASNNNSGTTTTTSLVDPIIGRHEEIRRCLQILGRRQKNNPILIGQAGVGKTAIAEGLAQRIVSGQVPESMKDKRVLSLDVSALVAGTRFRGQFEDRLKGLIHEVKQADGQIILFVDEIHTMVGAGGTSSDWDMDMGNILKPALARGELQLLGATTLDEYRRLEKDAALARRFQSVYVKEPTPQDTLSILRGLKPHYELHHAGIRIKDGALVAAVELSNRYITDRFQPDKSIDLIDEACSRLRLEQESKPEVLWRLERDLMTKQIEKSSLQGEEDTESKQRLDQVEQDIQQLQAKVKRVTAKWQEERQAFTRINEQKEQLSEAQRDLEFARSKGDYAKAGEHLHATIPRYNDELHQLEEEAEDAKKKKKKKKKKNENENKKKKKKNENENENENENKNKNKNENKKRLLSDAVTADAIATIVSRHTGIPVSRISGNATQKLLHMEDKLRERVVGQDHALEVVSNCVRLARTGLQARNRTLGNFLMVGPSGVGKTELCKALADFLFEDESAMTRIDMSEFGEKHSVSRLIGAPPGYVGYEKGGVLTESVRRRPYQVILLDEFEKAHPEVWNLLLQVFDDGRLTDSHGRVVDFCNAIIVMTSNMGASVIAELPSHLKGSEPEVHDSIMDIVRHTLSPELINRIDETIVFNRLQRENMDKICQMGIADIEKRLRDGQHMSLDVSNTAKACLAERGFDIRYGARPMKRVLAKGILNPLSKLVLEGAVIEGDVVRIRSRDEAIHLQKNHGDADFGWETSSSQALSEDKNDVVIIKNRDSPAAHKELVVLANGMGSGLAGEDDGDWGLDVDDELRT